MSKSFSITNAETRNLGGRPARTTDCTCVDLIRPKQIRPALHCIRSSLLIWQLRHPSEANSAVFYKIPDSHFYKAPVDMLGGHPNALYKINPCVAALLDIFRMQPPNRFGTSGIETPSFLNSRHKMSIKTLL
jgi:hypothetical protein